MRGLCWRGFRIKGFDGWRKLTEKERWRCAVFTHSMKRCLPPSSVSHRWLEEQLVQQQGLILNQQQFKESDQEGFLSAKMLTVGEWTSHAGRTGCALPFWLRVSYRLFLNSATAISVSVSQPGLKEENRNRKQLLFWVSSFCACFISHYIVWHQKYPLWFFFSSSWRAPTRKTGSPQGVACASPRGKHSAGKERCCSVWTQLYDKVWPLCLFVCLLVLFVLSVAFALFLLLWF